MVEITNGASITSKSPKRMLTDLRSTKSMGCRVKLTDDHWYIDWQLGLHGILYGYCPHWWAKALMEAVLLGSASSIAHEDEQTLANLLGEFYPDIEAVRFLANGSDPCSAAVKLARAVTGRDKILVYGYHGTGSAYAAPPTPFDADDNRLGTLQAERAAYHRLKWLGIEELASGTSDWRDFISSVKWSEIAAIIIECPPVDGGQEKARYWLQGLADWAHWNDSLFVLDEVVTGFRYGPDGAAGYYGLSNKVDLYCFGKTLGNGYPIAALAGKKSIMDWLSEAPVGGKVHWSGTWAGEPLGLAAAIAMLWQLKEQPPWKHMYALGKFLKERWNALDLPYKLKGHPTRPVMEGTDARFDDLRRYLFKHGHIVCAHPWYATMAHTRDDVEELVKLAREWGKDAKH